MATSAEVGQNLIGGGGVKLRDREGPRGHGDGDRFDAGLLDGRQYRLVRFGGREDFPLRAVFADVLDAGIQDQVHELVLGGLLDRDEDLALALEEA